LGWWKKQNRRATHKIDINDSIYTKNIDVYKLLWFRGAYKIRGKLRKNDNIVTKLYIYTGEVMKKNGNKTKTIKKMFTLISVLENIHIYGYICVRPRTYIDLQGELLL